jgi:hypothetical protein
VKTVASYTGTAIYKDEAFQTRKALSFSSLNILTQKSSPKVILLANSDMDLLSPLESVGLLGYKVCKSFRIEFASSINIDTAGEFAIEAHG